MLPLLSALELCRRQATESIVLLDARTGPTAQQRYQTGHLPGALFVDLEQDLAQPTNDSAQGGRHPLPAVADFARRLGYLGISPSTAVVVYDDKNAANAAARCWWMLRSIGHSAVQVLDGGLPAALAAGFLLSSVREQSRPLEPYPEENWHLPIASLAEVQRASQDSTAVIIDVREAARYRGETELIDLIAGHIPGAVNVPFISNLDETGRYLTPAALSEKYRAVLASYTSAETIVHCGSGVTACHTLLAFAQAGLSLPRLYPGSWSEWSRTGNPVALGV